MEWRAVHKGTGMKYTTAEARVVVQRTHWTRPGFRANVGRTATGWVVLVDGEQAGPAHGTAKKAREWAEQPGVWADLETRLGLQ